MTVILPLIYYPNVFWFPLLRTLLSFITIVSLKIISIFSLAALTIFCLLCACLCVCDVLLQCYGFLNLWTCFITSSRQSSALILLDTACFPFSLFFVSNFVYLPSKLLFLMSHLFLFHSYILDNSLLQSSSLFYRLCWTVLTLLLDPIAHLVSKLMCARNQPQSSIIQT